MSGSLFEQLISEWDRPDFDAWERRVPPPGFMSARNGRLYVRLPHVPGRMGAGWRRGNESAEECVARHLKRLGVDTNAFDSAPRSAVPVRDANGTASPFLSPSLIGPDQTNGTGWSTAKNGRQFLLLPGVQGWAGTVWRKGHETPDEAIARFTAAKSGWSTAKNGRHFLRRPGVQGWAGVVWRMGDETPEQAFC
jgi:hypothetical protein